jgi:peroxiredoxin Q/BCP
MKARAVPASQAVPSIAASCRIVRIFWTTDARRAEKETVLLTTGDTLPDLELENQDGQTVRLSDYRGRRLLLFAYPKAATPGCTKQACGFRDRMPEITAAGATVVGLSPDKPAALKRWQKRKSLPYDLLSDPDHQLLDALGAWGEQSFYGKKYIGVSRSHWVIDAEGRIEEAQIKVSPATSVERATEYLAG